MYHYVYIPHTHNQLPSFSFSPALSLRFFIYFDLHAVIIIPTTYIHANEAQVAITCHQKKTTRILSKKKNTIKNDLKLEHLPNTVNADVTFPDASALLHRKR